MTSVLVLNAGSSSLKVRALDDEDHVTAVLDLEHWDGRPDHEELEKFLQAQDGVDVIGHRVVHGGSRFSRAAAIDEAVISAIEDLASLAPLHQRRALDGIRAARAALPGRPAFACFDTAFHATLPAAAATFALPGAWTARYGLRRYGFHGLSHAYAARRSAQLTGQDAKLMRVVTCHLGAGSSLAAIQNGISADTTMGFTPLDGLVMATRPGSLDPGLLIWLLQQHRLSLAEVAHGLEYEAGLAGLAGGSGDMRDIRAAAAAGSDSARLAIEVHAHRLRAEIAAMAAAMDGLDVLAFTGGIGEHQPEGRAEAAAGLGFLGVAIDPVANAAATSDADISAAGAAVRTLVITAREDLEIARQVRAALRESP